jgi:hypothetical protein
MSPSSSVRGSTPPLVPFIGNWDATPPPASTGTPAPPAVANASGATPTPHDLPAFPLDEIQAEDLVDDDDDSDPVELPLERGIGSKVIDGLREARNSLLPLAARAKRGMGPLAQRAKDRLSPMADRTKQSLSPLAGRTRRWFATKVAPAIEDGFAYVKANPKDPKVMLGLGGVALLVLVLLVVLAASSGGKGTSQASTEPQAGSRSIESPEPTAARVVEPAAAVQKTAPATACRVTKEAVRLAGDVSKDVPIELDVGASGDVVRAGFATRAGTAQGLAIDLASFTPMPEFSVSAQGKVRGVVPIMLDGKPSYAVNGDGPGDKMQAWRTLADASFVVGWADGAIAAASKSTDAPAALWRLDGDEVPDAIRGASMADQGQAVVFRRRGEIFLGMLDAGRKPRGSLVKVIGAGAPPGSPVGAPAIAANGQAIAVAFADRASSSDPWQIRIGSAPFGKLPSQTSAFDVPSGGPGRTAIAPAVAGLADGRWLLVWTEGSGGDHDVRAQTLDPEMRPLGGPFTVSHEGSNAGQGAAAVEGGRGVVAYLALTGKGYEVWGAAVDCR